VETRRQYSNALLTETDCRRLSIFKHSMSTMYV